MTTKVNVKKFDPVEPEKKEYQCGNCGGKFAEKYKRCPYCGVEFA